MAKYIKKNSVTGDTLLSNLLMENIQGTSIMDSTDSTLIQSRVLQLQLSCLQIPLSILNPVQQWQTEKTPVCLKKHYAKGKKPNTLPSLWLACVNVCICGCRIHASIQPQWAIMKPFFACLIIAVSSVQHRIRYSDGRSNVAHKWLFILYSCSRHGSLPSAEYYIKNSKATAISQYLFFLYFYIIQSP